LGTVHVAGDRTAGSLEGRRIGARQIAAQGRPVPAAVRRLPQSLRGRVQRAWIDGREDDRERPLPALADLYGRLARVEPRVRVHLPRRAVAAVELVDVAAVVG